MKFCVDCEHRKQLDATATIRCGHPSSARTVDPVTGKDRPHWDCASQRADDRACGPEGKWFEDIKF